MTIVGGGILGLAVAERASRAGHRVTVLEKEESWARHQTGRNSGVIHAGPYYKPGSLKARMCVEGNRRMAAFAVDHGITHQITGKLIVATSEGELPALRALADRAAANGVEARLISPNEVADYEPHVRAVAALRVEATGIIDYVGVSNKLAELAEGAGAELRANTEVLRVMPEGSGVVVEHTRGEQHADVLVNCAGLYSDQVARRSGLSPSARIIPFRGEYFHLSAAKEDLVRGLIYPVPDPTLPFLGVHLTRTVTGGVHAGPNAVTALGRENYTWRDLNLLEAVKDLAYPGFLRMAAHNIGTGIDEVRRSLSRARFAASLARLVPGIEANDLLRSPSGIRAQAILRNGNLVDDFLIERAPSQIHVLNAPSPAATSALVIADHICREAGLTL